MIHLNYLCNYLEVQSDYLYLVIYERDAALLRHMLLVKYWQHGAMREDALFLLGSHSGAHEDMRSEHEHEFPAALL